MASRPPPKRTEAATENTCCWIATRRISGCARALGTPFTPRSVRPGAPPPPSFCLWTLADPAELQHPVCPAPSPIHASKHGPLPSAVRSRSSPPALPATVAPRPLQRPGSPQASSSSMAAGKARPTSSMYIPRWRTGSWRAGPSWTQPASRQRSK